MKKTFLAPRGRFCGGKRNLKEEMGERRKGQESPKEITLTSGRVYKSDCYIDKQTE